MMSSETSSSSRRKRQAVAPPAGRRPSGGQGHAGQGVRPGREVAIDAALNLQPLHLLILGTAAAASAAALLAHGTRPANIVFVVLSVIAAGVVAIAVFRTLWPLASDVTATQPEMVGGRTRAALEREKTIVLRAIKELEFDRAMGKLSETDFHEMSGRLRARAAGLIRQLDTGAGYRDQVERDLAKRLAEGAAPVVVRGTFCTECGTKNEPDAKFCKNCGQRL